jgi:hypothetical protein
MKNQLGNLKPGDISKKEIPYYELIFDYGSTVSIGVV